VASLYGQNLVVSACVGTAIFLLFWAAWAVLGEERIAAMSLRQRNWFFSLVPIVGVLIGWPIGLTLVNVDVLRVVGAGNPQQFLRFMLVFGLIALLFNLIFANKARAIEAEKREAEARLALLQAQMEPHFLFNTLANVHGLIEHDPAKARAMLGAFTDYLRASLAEMRREQAPLADELALAEAYLRVQGTRMEERLRWQVEADDTARRALLPPLLLQPLVENAVQHGLEPQVAGGTVRVSAHVQGGKLVLEVRDDGRGLQAAPSRRGAGLALANIRERLAARFGDGAVLELTAAEPGTLARLTLPLRSAS
jgi:sensor histidine kinase YesM